MKLKVYLSVLHKNEFHQAEVIMTTFPQSELLEKENKNKNVKN